MRLAHSIVSVAAIVAFAPLGACAREGAAVVAPVEVTIDHADGGVAMPLVIGAPAVATDRDRCTAVLRPAAIQTNPGCTLDERLSHGNGTLLYPCAGDGAVEAIFGEHHFIGKLTGTTLVLRLETELDWEDGCHWKTNQTIVASFARDKPRSRSRWSYSEAPVSGTGCYGSCTATADIEIAREDAKP